MLKKLDSMNQKRSEIIKRYMNGISAIDEVDSIVPYEPGKYVYQMYGIRTDHKDDVILYLKNYKLNITNCINLIKN